MLLNLCFPLSFVKTTEVKQKDTKDIIYFLLKQSAKPTQIKTGNVVCPDGQSQCPDGNTCCKLSSEEYGCCPLPNAVCCSDGAHCCPEKYTCDIGEGMCIQGLKKFPFFQKLFGKPLTINNKKKDRRLTKMSSQVTGWLLLSEESRYSLLQYYRRGVLLSS